MGWEDREYYRDRDGGELAGPLRWLLFGSVPLFTAFGIRVRAHIGLIIFIALVLLFGGVGYSRFGWQFRFQSMSVLFVIILLHEFGHCFAGRWMGGNADEIILTPLGGLAMANAPRRPMPTLITVAGGPAVNVLICIVAGVALALLKSRVPLNPFDAFQGLFDFHSFSFGSYVCLAYGESLLLLVFNLLPIFPLDGGQLLQAALWFKIGFFRSMNIACLAGMVGGALLALAGLFKAELLMLFIAVNCIWNSFAQRRQLREMGPDFEYGEEPYDFSASLRPDPPQKTPEGEQVEGSSAARAGTA